MYSHQPDGSDAKAPAELTIIIVSYNTRELTLKCLETLYAETVGLSMRVVVFDNDSADGSADAIAAHYPDTELIRNPENIGFARANNLVAESVTSEWMLLLNPDTEVHAGAISNLLSFSKKHPEAGITGGRTVFPDGSLNIASCWRRITPWSLFCSTFYLTNLLPRSELFNPEAMGGWQRNTVRRVDIVVGCFLMIRTALWRELDGFDARYFMYGEEADLCLRAARKGYRPMITPDAQIMHLVGASSSKRTDKALRVIKAKTTLIRDHWSRFMVPVGIAQMWFWAALRRIVSSVVAAITKNSALRDHWALVWKQRHDWLAGYK
jgi:N-acetylglucosaminyl-diphospho-decaprenol L-rhamnosyltransferase